MSNWAMPGMNGLELARQLSQRHEAVRVLMMIDYTLDSATRERAPAAVVGWLRKPPDLDELSVVVARALAAGA